MAAQQRQPAGDQVKLLVVTDLDGTLLDHHSYSLLPAIKMIQRLRSLDIPLVFNTSKTFAESEALSEKLGLSAPFIVENGSAIYYPKRRFLNAPDDTHSNGAWWTQVLGTPHAEIITMLKPLAEKYQFRGLSDFTLSEIVAGTGLSMTEAQRARSRQFSEPLVWCDSEQMLHRFLADIAQLGLRTLRGGRFLHVLGQTDKGQAMQALKASYAKDGHHWQTIALGDSDNDIAMLEAADHAVIIRSPTHEPPELNRQTSKRTSTEYGPAGWSTCVGQLLDELTAI